MSPAGVGRIPSRWILKAPPHPTAFLENRECIEKAGYGGNYCSDSGAILGRIMDIPVRLHLVLVSPRPGVPMSLIPVFPCPSSQCSCPHPAFPVSLHPFPVFLIPMFPCPSCHFPHAPHPCFLVSFIPVFHAPIPVFPCPHPPFPVSPSLFSHITHPPFPVSFFPLFPCPYPCFPCPYPSFPAHSPPCACGAAGASRPRSSNSPSGAGKKTWSDPNPNIPGWLLPVWGDGGRGGGTSKGNLGLRNVAVPRGGISIRAAGGFEHGDFIPGVWSGGFSGIKGKLGCAGIQGAWKAGLQIPGVSRDSLGIPGSNQFPALHLPSSQISWIQNPLG